MVFRGFRFNCSFSNPIKYFDWAAVAQKTDEVLTFKYPCYTCNLKKKDKQSTLLWQPMTFLDRELPGLRSETDELLNLSTDYRI